MIRYCQQPNLTPKFYLRATGNRTGIGTGLDKGRRAASPPLQHHSLCKAAPSVFDTLSLGPASRALGSPCTYHNPIPVGLHEVQHPGPNTRDGLSTHVSNWAAGHMAGIRLGVAGARWRASIESLPVRIGTVAPKPWAQSHNL